MYENNFKYRLKKIHNFSIYHNPILGGKSYKYFGVKGSKQWQI